MNFKEIKIEFGDCDWMRAFLNTYTVDAILWLMDRVEKLEAELEFKQCLCTPSPPLIIARDIQITKNGKLEGGNGGT